MRFLHFLLPCALCLMPHAQGAQRPNILVILVDDMGYSDLGCYGSEIKTPNLDALAAKGIRYTQMYNTAKCFPTRACLMTGVWFQRTDREFPGTATAGEVLQPAGYRTLWTGKHHAHFNPVTRGFDRFAGFLGGAINSWHPGATAREGEKEPQRITHYNWVVDGKQIPEFVPPKGWHSTDGFTDWALEWLEQQEKEQPFFLYVAYNAPHWPLHAHPEDIAKYDGVYDRGYEAIRQGRFLRQLATGLFDESTATLPDDPLAENWKKLSKAEQELEADRMEIHAAMVDRIDQNVGRLVKALKAKGAFENTLILFLADNGASAERTNRAKLGNSSGPIGGLNSYECIGRNWAHACDTPLRFFKTSSHEGGINTPMIAHWPAGIEAKGTICRETCHLIDLLPTWMELAGAAYPGASQERNIPALDGVSIAPTFSGNGLDRKGPLFFEWGSGTAVRDGQWKLVRAGNAAWELYDFSADRTEMQNVADRYPQRVASMRKGWEAWYKGCTGKAYAAKGGKKKAKN